jgi:hypothetical protein
MWVKLFRSVTSLALLAAILIVTGTPATPATAQDAPPKPGICDGVICGPSGEYTASSFATISNIDWGAFPTDIARGDYAPTGGGREIFVAPGGSDQHDGSQGAPLATINHAVEIAQTGDVIWVADGEYAIGEDYEYEALILNTPGIILAAATIGGVTLVPAGDNEPPVVAIAATADDLIVDGFVIQDFRSVGVEFGNVNTPQQNVLLKHLLIENTEEGIRSAYGGSGSQPLIEGLLIYDVWLRDISLIALQCGEGPCNDMRWEALRVDMPGGDEDNSGADALAMESGENIVVFNVEISGAAGDGIDLKASRVAVANVYVHDIGRNGIKLWYGGDVINALVNNTGADAAIVFDTGDSYRMLNTIVARHSWGDSAYAMTVAYDHPTDPGQLQIINCVFYQNAGAVWVSPAFDLDVRNSVFFGSGNGEEVVWGNTTVGEAAAPMEALETAGGGADNLGFVDPLFADPNGGDYFWPDTSPLLDAGTDTVGSVPAFDLVGQPRLVGAGIDLGPWEKQEQPAAGCAPCQDDLATVVCLLD